LRSVEADRFLYLIQEYEPLTLPAGTFAALALESYGFPHAELFSSEPLRDYFRAHGLGVYADGADAGDRSSAVFQDAVTAARPPTVGELTRPGPRRLLFHAGPEPHAASAMFELGVLALSRALELGAFARDWDLHAAGAMRSGRRLDLGGGDWMQLLPPLAEGDRAALLRPYDAGLALMYGPHPGLVPIEMAAAGMLTVTNAFENKNAETMAAISPNLITADAGIESIAGALCRAAAEADDLERRVRGSAVRWSRDWDESFGDALLDRVTAFLTA
jgi:hypothetical protein